MNQGKLLTASSTPPGVLAALQVLVGDIGEAAQTHRRSTLGGGSRCCPSGTTSTAPRSTARWWATRCGRARESCYALYQATGEAQYLRMGAEMVASLNAHADEARLRVDPIGGRHARRRPRPVLPRRDAQVPLPPLRRRQLAQRPLDAYVLTTEAHLIPLCTAFSAVAPAAAPALELSGNAHVESLPVGQLRELISSAGLAHSDCLEKHELRARGLVAWDVKQRRAKNDEERELQRREAERNEHMVCDADGATAAAAASATPPPPPDGGVQGPREPDGGGQRRPAAAAAAPTRGGRAAAPAPAAAATAGGGSGSRAAPEQHEGVVELDGSVRVRATPSGLTVTSATAACCCGRRRARRATCRSSAPRGRRARCHARRASRCLPRRCSGHRRGDAAQGSPVTRRAASAAASRCCGGRRAAVASNSSSPPTCSACDCVGRVGARGRAAVGGARAARRREQGQGATSSCSAWARATRRRPSCRCALADGPADAPRALRGARRGSPSSSTARCRASSRRRRRPKSPSSSSASAATRPTRAACGARARRRRRRPDPAVAAAARRRRSASRRRRRTARRSPSSSTPAPSPPSTRAGRPSLGCAEDGSRRGAGAGAAAPPRRRSSLRRRRSRATRAITRAALRTSRRPRARRRRRRRRGGGGRRRPPRPRRRRPVAAPPVGGGRRRLATEVLRDACGNRWRSRGAGRRARRWRATRAAPRTRAPTTRARAASGANGESCVRRRCGAFASATRRARERRAGMCSSGDRKRRCRFSSTWPQNPCVRAQNPCCAA